MNCHAATTLNHDTSYPKEDTYAWFEKHEKNPMKSIPLNEVKDDLSKYLRLAEKQEIAITRHGAPAGLLIGFASEDDWLDYRLEHDPRFLRRIADARRSILDEKGVQLEDVDV